MASSTIFKARNGTWSVFHIISPWLSLLPLPSIFKDSCDLTESTQIIQDTLCISILSTSAKSPLPRNITCAHVPRSRTWTLWWCRRCYLPTTVLLVRGDLARRYPRFLSLLPPSVSFSPRSQRTSIHQPSAALLCSPDFFCGFLPFWIKPSLFITDHKGQHNLVHYIWNLLHWYLK